MPVVCIDPGHGGLDPGASAPSVREADLALDYGLDLADALADRNVPAVLTRTRDRTLKLSDRSQLANCSDAAVFVSLHFNWSGNREAHGPWIIHYEHSRVGEDWAEAVADALSGIAIPDNSGWTGSRSLHVLRRTRMPAILVEFGFLSNPQEAERLQRRSERTRLVNELADVIASRVADK